MNVYVCTDHDAKWPVPVASVVLAPDEGTARELLDAELVRHGLKPHAEEPYELRLIGPEMGAHVLSDGEY